MKLLFKTKSVNQNVLLWLPKTNTKQLVKLNARSSSAIDLNSMQRKKKKITGFQIEWPLNQSINLQIWQKSTLFQEQDLPGGLITHSIKTIGLWSLCSLEKQNSMTIKKWLQVLECNLLTSAESRFQLMDLWRKNSRILWVQLMKRRLMLQSTSKFKIISMSELACRWRMSLSPSNTSKLPTKIVVTTRLMSGLALTCSENGLP